MILFFSFIIALFVSAALISPLSKQAIKYQFVDRPGDRKVHSGDIPRIGGVAMVLGAVIPILMWANMDRDIVALLIGLLIIFIFGIWDDRKNLGYRTKFFGQILAVLVVIMYGDIQIVSLPLIDDYVVPRYVSFFITFFVLLGVTNAINLADGLDGLAGGITLLSFGVITILGFLADGIAIEIISVAIMGSIFGFLRFNTYPARVFMGDSGSQFLGFSVGVLAVMLTQNVNTAISPALPLLIVGLPLIDTMMVMSQRIYEGNSPFKPDSNHIHHKLLTRGFDHYEAVIIIYLLQAIYVLSAYFMRYEPDIMIIAVFVFYCAVWFAFAYWTKKIGWKFHKEKDKNEKHLVTQYINWVTHETHLSKWIYWLSIAAIFFYIALSALLVSEVTTDIGVLALSLVLVSLFFFVRQYKKPLDDIERACVYVACTVIVYSVQTTDFSGKWPDIFLQFYLTILGIGVVVGVWYSKQKRLAVTPLDFLVVFIALTVPNLPIVRAVQAHLGFSIAILIVTYYALEMILNSASTKHNLVRYTLLFSMGLFAFRSFA